MKRSFAILACTFALGVVMFAPSKASAGGYYGAGYGYGCGCCVTYCYGWVRGRGFNRRYAYPRYYVYDDGYAYPRTRAEERRALRRERRLDN